jgi:integrase/recombinase XerD
MKQNRNGQAEALTPQLFKRVYSEIDHPMFKIVFGVAWYTAERPGTILILKVTDVYSGGEPRGAIVFPKNSRKDRKTREVPVSKSLKAILKEYDYPIAGWLFPSAKNADHPCPFDTYSKYLKAKFESLGLQGFSTYSTRRGAITHLSKQGLSPRQIQQISGHSSLDSLQRYIDRDPEAIKRGMELL